MKQKRNQNCFEKTKVRWGIFKKLSCTNVDLDVSARLLLTHKHSQSQTMPML